MSRIWPSLLSLSDLAVSRFCWRVKDRLSWYKGDTTDCVWHESAPASWTGRDGTPITIHACISNNSDLLPVPGVNLLPAAATGLVRLHTRCMKEDAN